MHCIVEKLPILTIEHWNYSLLCFQVFSINLFFSNITILVLCVSPHFLNLSWCVYQIWKKSLFFYILLFKYFFNSQHLCKCSLLFSFPFLLECNCMNIKYFTDIYVSPLSFSKYFSFLFSLSASYLEFFFFNF